MKVFSREFKDDERQDGIVVLKLSMLEEIQNNYNFIKFLLGKMWIHYVLHFPIDRAGYCRNDEEVKKNVKQLYRKARFR